MHLERRAAAAPVLVCLDDLHWAGPATLAALRALPKDLRRHPVAWLLARSSTPHRDVDCLFGLLEQDGAARITLAPLGNDAVAAMPTDAFGAPPGQGVADLAAGAAGNPALLAELIGGLRDDHAVQVAGGRAVLDSARLPRRIHRLAQRRLDGLSQRARHLLVTAAVLGRAFRPEDAAEMLGQTPATLLPAVQEAMDAAIMTAADDAFAFRHQLLRRAVGEMIPQPARNALHRQYGQILLARGQSPARAAGHLLQAAGQLADAAADGQAALATARALSAHGYAATAHTVLAVIELRRGDIAAAAQHLTARPAASPQSADIYARPETTVAEAQVTEARDGPAGALGHLGQFRADLGARPGLLLATPLWRPGWLAPHWPPAPPAPPRTSPTPTRGSRPWTGVRREISEVDDAGGPGHADPEAYRGNSVPGRAERS